MERAELGGGEAGPAGDAHLDANVDADADANADANADVAGDGQGATGADAGSAGDGGAGMDAQPAWRAADGGCSPGAQRCAGAQLATCGSAGDGWTLSPCFPGQYCAIDHCVPLKNNLIIVFDTSGSMNTPVPGVSCNQAGFPACDPAKGCSRMDVSKQVFLQALQKINTNTTRLALFRFPQRLMRTSGATCASGYLVGAQTLTGDTGGAQSVSATTAWYWDAIHEIRCVPYPSSEAESQLGPVQLSRWMDGVEALSPPGKVCGNGGALCHPNTTCGAGSCCQQRCVVHTQPELRASGGTPIGKTLFYVGEYLRHRVIVDGLPCQSDAGCGNPNYRCAAGVCVDVARDCRETVIVLFTDGGQANDPTKFFSPRVAAQRLAYGLACASSDDCVGGATCVQGRCVPPSPTGYHCVATGAPCLPTIIDPKSPLICQSSGGKVGGCLKDVFAETSAKATAADANVLRSPDGAPFGVRLHVVDISEASTLGLSHHLAIAGGGRLFTASSADPLAFISALESAFDMKNKTVCGTTR